MAAQSRAMPKSLIVFILIVFLVLFHKDRKKKDKIPIKNIQSSTHIPFLGEKYHEQGRAVIGNGFKKLQVIDVSFLERKKGTRLSPDAHFIRIRAMVI